MDTHQEVIAIKDFAKPTTQLFVGAPSAVTAHVIAYVQKQFCAHDGCGICIVCKNIATRNYYATTWIAPTERYTLEDLEPLMQTVALQLDDGQEHYIIIEHADALTPLCANALLKTIEEPPRGYHIILLAHIVDRMILTVRSRCLLIHVPGAQSDLEHPLISCFIQPSLPEPAAFLKLIEQNKLTEQENFALLDTLLAKLIATMREQYAYDQTPNATLDHHYTLLTRMCSRALMPGSAKIIWRELFLQWDHKDVKMTQTRGNSN